MEHESTMLEVKSAGSGLSSYSSLYRDVLQSIFQFLDLNQFVDACRVNQSSYAAGRTMKSRNDALIYCRPIAFLTQSPLRLHITHLEIDLPALPSLNLVFELRDQLSHLESLRISLRFFDPDDEHPPLSLSSPFWALPTHLHTLTLEFDCWMFGGSSISQPIQTLSPYLSRCMKAIATSASRLVKLDINLVVGVSELNYCPRELQTISTITDLSLPKEFHLNPTIDLINSMPSLRRLRTPNIWTRDSLQRLADGFNAAHSPQLEDIGYLSNVDESFAHQLKRLVTLTRLNLFLSLPDPTILLPHLHRLSHLKLRCFSSVNVDLLTRALSSSITLITLEIYHPRLLSDHVTQFLPHLNLLMVLKFHDCSQLVSLEFLTQARDSLTHLHTFVIQSSFNMPVKEYDHLKSIAPTLEYLTIAGSCTSRFDASMISRWTPDSDEFCSEDWPRLKQFKLKQLDSSGEWVI